MYVYHEQFGVQLRTVKDVMQFCVDEEIELWPPSPSFGVILRPRGGGSGNGRQELTASMVTVFRLIRLSVGLYMEVCIYSIDAIYTDLHGL